MIAIAGVMLGFMFMITAYIDREIEGDWSNAKVYAVIYGGIQMMIVLIYLIGGNCLNVE